MRLTPTFLAMLLPLALAYAAAAPPQEREAPASKSGKAEGGEESTKREGAKKESAKKTDSDANDEPVVTHHEVALGGSILKYKVTTGQMPIKDSQDKTEAHIFYIAYTAETDKKAAERPLMFSFNGGPGSSSVWLHLGALGPKRVKMPSDAKFPAPPFQLVDNEYTWLDKTDLVFIDPVGTGYSRAEKPEQAKKFFGMQGDVESVGDFIRMYLTREERWASPLFLVGESYGTTRAAGLAGYLIDRGVAFNGIVLVSSVLSFQTISFGRGNDLPYVLYLPVFTATAWYHKKLSDVLQLDLKSTLEQAEKWAANDYAKALSQGDQLKGEERQKVVDALAKFTGLDKSFIEDSDLRVSGPQFSRELLRKEKRVVGRIDSRYTGTLGLDVEGADRYDPSMAAITAPYTSTFLQYLRSELGYKSDKTYHILGTGIGRWDWGPTGRGYPEVTDALRSALNQNPHMKLYIASGYYDLATPYFATEYTLDHMGLDPSIRKNIRTGEYEAGHMMYLHNESLAKLKREVGEFINGAVGD